MLDRSFGALSHPARRHLIEVLSRGPSSVGHASRGLGLSKAAVTKHVRLLEDAGLVVRSDRGPYTPTRARADRAHRACRLARCAAAAMGIQARYDRRDARRGTERLSDDSSVLRLERYLDAPPERIFAAWTDPDVLRRWWAAEPDWTTAEAATDVRVGGRYRLAMRDGEGVVRTVVGEYLEIDPPVRLVYTWTWESTAEPPAINDTTIVTVDFLAEGPGTRVVLEQRGFTSQQDTNNHERGWGGCLDSLERRVLAGLP